MSSPLDSGSPTAAVAATDIQLDVREPVTESRTDPCHPHGGPELPTASVGSSAARSDIAANAPPIAILHRDALESAFAFLGLRELAAALRVSQGWLGAVNSMPRLELTAWNPSAPIRVVCKSAMGRHIIGLKSASLNADALFIIAEHMAHIRELGGRIDLPPPGQPLAFPPQLRWLAVDVTDTRRRGQINVAIAAVGRLLHLEKFVLSVRAMDPRISFAPLAALPRLRCLSVWTSWSGSGEFSDAQADQLRALPHLQELDVTMTQLLLRELLRQPHQLRWQQISLPRPLCDAALLPQVPSLATIRCWTTCSSFEWLRGLPNLTDVDLFSFRQADAADCSESLVAALRSCSAIEILSLSNFAGLTVAHLAELLPRLPCLRELRLIGAEIDSLSFLSQPPLTSQLSKLWLASCRRLPPGDLQHVHALRGLRTLSLSGCFTTPLGDHERALLAPPSALLPLLQVLKYEAPVVVTVRDSKGGE